MMKDKLSKKGVREVELAIRKAQERIAEEGKTDEIEEQLDQIEHRINNLKQSGVDRVVIKRLKSALDIIK